MEILRLGRERLNPVDNLRCPNLVKWVVNDNRLDPEPTRGGPTPGQSITCEIFRVTDGITHLGGDGWYCVPCYPDLPADSDQWPTYGTLGLDPVSATASGLDPGGHILPIEDALGIIRAAPHVNRHLYARPVQMAAYPFVYGTVSFWFASCEKYDGVYGAESRPSHTPSHHGEIFCGGIGCICSSGPVWFVGARHDLFNTRNLSFHPDEPAEHKKYLHCLGLIYSGKTTNLLDFIESFGLDLSDRVKWVVNDKPQPSHTLTIGSEPSDLDPKIFWVKMLEKDTDTEWDRFVLVVNNKRTKERFDTWYARFSVEIGWLAELPAAYIALAPGNKDPEPSSINLWEGIRSPGKYYHHTSVYEMRSAMTPNGHGHQACYGTNGVLVTQGVSAGTADFGHWKNFARNAKPWGTNLPSHEDEDVKPFIRALQLDGNPSKGERLNTRLTHALMFSGPHIDKYLECRPPIPNSKPLLAPGTVPTP